MIKILFICRFNRFRSQLAAGYFRKYCPKNIAIAKSAGLIKGNPIGKEVKQLSKKENLSLTKPKGLERSIINEQDLFVIVADDVPPVIFEIYKKRGKRVKVWKVKDTHESDKEEVTKTASIIKNRVLELIKELETKA